MNRNARPSRAIGAGFAIWFAFCAALGLASIGLLAWLVVAAIQWLGRH